MTGAQEGTIFDMLSVILINSACGEGGRGPRGGDAHCQGLSPGCRASGMAPRDPQGPLPSGSWESGKQKGNAALAFLAPASLSGPTQLPWKLGPGLECQGWVSSALLPIVFRTSGAQHPLLAPPLSPSLPQGPRPTR